MEQHIQHHNAGNIILASITAAFAVLGKVVTVDDLQILAYSISILVGCGTFINLCRKWRNEWRGRRIKRK